MKRPRTAVLLGFVLASFLLRLAPWALNHFQIMSVDPETTIYPWNFSPFYSICLFGAAFMVQRRSVFLLMLGSWLAGDIAIGLVYGNWKFAFYPNQVFVYFAYALMIAVGFYLRKHRDWGSIFATGLVGACVFFAVSNFGEWALGGGVVYPHNWGGLMKCYAAAIPFFRNSVISMAFFLPVLFSGLAVKSAAPEPAADLAVQAG